ncbi:MAG: hypothetical protein JSV62_10475 [Promethearchaeota archaeon]|nr:MAG: hypothetical protein JSV62_10475 [Candidatus Lokiarchaeota archaeon]
MFDIFKYYTFSGYFFYFLGILAGFTFILLIISLFSSFKKIGIIIIIAAALTLPVMWIFSWIIGFNIFFVISFLANVLITAFFAFKFCMDTSTKIDNYLYEKKKSRIFTRIIEFVGFFLLNWWLTSLIVRFFGFPSITRVFFNLFLIGLLLLAFVLTRLIFTKKLAAYISVFNLLTSFYVLYLIVDLLAEFIFYDSSGYDIFSFFIDFLLFIYIIGSIYDRVDYIKEKIKILRVDTIALFIILMKLLVQILRIRQELWLPYFPLLILQQIISQVQLLWIFFAFFTILVGIYTIFKHKEGKKS